MLHVPTHIATYGELYKHIVICSPTSGRRHWGTWKVTDVREGKAIYSGYILRFWQAFPAEVCFVFNYDVLKALVVIKTIFDVLP